MVSLRPLFRIVTEGFLFSGDIYTCNAIGAKRIIGVVMSVGILVVLKDTRDDNVRVLSFTHRAFV